MTELILPYPPSVNRLWERARKGMRRTDEYIIWLAEAAREARKQKPQAVSGAYKISIFARRPDKRKRDLGNLLKATEDLLVSVGVIDDDSKAEAINMRWVTNGAPFTVRVEAAGVE